MNLSTKDPGTRIFSSIQVTPVLMQIGLACVALALGVLVYVTDRSAIPAVVPHGQLPDFVHIFAFILVSAALAQPTRAGLFKICIGWLCLECLLEAGQHAAFSQAIADWLATHAARAPGTTVVQHFFLHGTFDWLDVASFMLGSALAFFTVSTISRRYLI